MYSSIAASKPRCISFSSSPLRPHEIRPPPPRFRGGPGLAGEGRGEGDGLFPQYLPDHRGPGGAEGLVGEAIVAEADGPVAPDMDVPAVHSPVPDAGLVKRVEGLEHRRPYGHGGDGVHPPPLDEPAQVHSVIQPGSRPEMA